MDETRKATGGYLLKKVAADTTLLYGFAQECCMYVINGRDRVLLVDTGMGTGDLKAALAAIAPGKPAVVVNTHGHADHCGGNDQFPEVFLHPGAWADADHAEEEKKTLPAEEAMAGVEHYAWARRPLKQGEQIELGDRCIEVIETPGHTPGCLSFLDRKQRVLLCGDLVCSNDHCTHMLAYVEWFRFSTVSIETFLRSLEKVERLGAEYDVLCGGHDQQPLEKKYLTQIIDLCRSILDGTAKPYHPQLAPHYGNIQCWRLDGPDTAILYQDEVIFDRPAEGGR